MNRRGSVLLLMSWCLLSVWMLYGGLELAEELNLVVHVQSSGADLDMDALLQLGSGLKPDLPLFDNQASTPSLHTADPSWKLTLTCQIGPIGHRSPRRPRSLRLHQYLSIYLI